MAKIILITGGARSGKSRYAEELAVAEGGERLYLATCPAPDSSDPEMAARVEAHKEQRKHKGWQTVEEPLDLCGILKVYQSTSLILIDCLTLWVANLMSTDEDLDESAISVHAEALLAALASSAGTVIMVTNEVGQGIVPDNRLARRYRDLIGRLNQTIAAAADRVFLVSCGLPLQLK